MVTAMERAGRRTKQKNAWVAPVMGVVCLGGAFYATFQIQWPLGLVAAIPMGFVAFYLMLVANIRRGS